MWERSELKSNAKRALSRYYWMAVLVTFIYGLLSGAGSGSYASFNTGDTTEKILKDPSVEQFIAIYLPVIIGVIVLIFVVALAFGFFVINPLSVGLFRFFMESRTFKSDFSTLFYGFSGGRYFRIVKVLAIRDVKLTLWSLLFLIPGIIKTYEYFMIPFLLAENSDLETSRYFEISRHMTDGDKLNIWVLGLSFIGWTLLGALTCGIGLIFLQPYVLATYAELYALMRAKALTMGFSNQGELKDFLPPVFG